MFPRHALSEPEDCPGCVLELGTVVPIVKDAYMELLGGSK